MAGEDDIAAGVLGDRLLERQAAFDDRQRLGVADPRKAGKSRRVAGDKAARLLHETRVELGAGAGVDAGAQDRRLDAQPEPQDRSPVAPRLREWRVSPETGDLDGPHDAARVAQVHGRGPHGREPAQLRHEHGQAVRGEGRLHRGTHLRVPGQLVDGQPTGHGTEIEARAADQQRDGAPLGDPRQRLPGMGREIGHAERHVRIHEIQAVVRDPGPLFGSDLGRADVHASVDLPRVGGDDLGRDAPGGELLRERQR